MWHVIFTKFIYNDEENFNIIKLGICPNSHGSVMDVFWGTIHTKFIYYILENSNHN